MYNLLQYLLKFSISLSVVYIFYRLVLCRLTFYNWNRWYLVGYSLLCFAIPYINITMVLQARGLQDSKFVGFIPMVEKFAETTATSPAAHSFSWQAVYLILLMTGALFMVLRLIFQYRSLKKLRSSGIVLHDEKVKLIHIDKDILPFSFGNSIYINQQLHTPEELREIIRHEFIHIKQKHSVDILIGELLCIINWFNPFAWLIRKAIRQNLEFIADNNVLQNGVDKKQYQYLLLKVTGMSRFSITNNFNLSSLKTRIAMMNKMKSAKLHLVKFLFILPLMIVLLVSFRNYRHSKISGVIAVAGSIVTDTVPAPPPPPPPGPPPPPKEPKKTPPPPKKPVKADVQIKADSIVIEQDVAPVKAETETIQLKEIRVVPKNTVTVAPKTAKTIVYDVAPAVAVNTESVKAVSGNVQTVGSASTIVEGDKIVISGKGQAVGADSPDGEKVLRVRRTTTRAQLDEIKKDLEAKGFILTIKDVDFKDNQLVSIRASVQKGDQIGNFEAADFDTVAIIYVPGEKPYFTISVMHGKVIFNNNRE